MDNSNIFYTSWKTITDYFIDNTIIINNNDDYKTYIEKFLLKYKRVIGLVLLIILLIIGYFEYYKYNSKFINDNKINKVNGIQIGGKGRPATPAPAPAAPAPAPAAPAAPGAAPGAPGAAPTADQKKKGLASRAVGKGYAAGAAVAEGIRNNADWFYGMLYAIVISLAVFMVVIPSIAFFIIGIICYFLLKDKMKTLKGF